MSRFPLADLFRFALSSVISEAWSGVDARHRRCLASFATVAKMAAGGRQAAHHVCVETRGCKAGPAASRLTPTWHAFSREGQRAQQLQPHSQPQRLSNSQRRADQLGGSFTPNTFSQPIGHSFARHFQSSDRTERRGQWNQTAPNRGPQADEANRKDRRITCNE